MRLRRLSGLSGSLCDRGATFPEYALMTTLIAIATFTGAAALGLEVKALLELPFP